MKSMILSAALFVGLMVAVAGCGDKPADDKKPNDKPNAGTTPHDHSGWWCDEHGVVEAECSMCQKKVFARLKPSELCPKHPDRAAAQCFICNPELWEKSKAVHVAKVGAEPPMPKENMPGKK
jgi:hypothetical protein